MTTTRKMKDVFAQRNPSRTRTRTRRSPEPTEDRQLCPVLVSISRMTDDEIIHMSTSDLIDLLAMSTSAPQWGDFVRDVPQSGPAGLRLLAMLARRCCRDAVQNVCERRGYPAPRYPLAAS